VVETGRGSAPLAVVSGPESLLATKLYFPRPPSGLVPRPRLADLLEQGLAHPLVLVCAPAGFGKTALLADSCRQRRQQVAWLCLDAADNDPMRFWRHAVAALDRVRPGVGERVDPLLSGPGLASFDGFATAVVNRLADDPGEVLLVLDDYHVIDTEAVHASVLFLVEHAPPGLHVVLASRADPPWPLGRLRARGQLAELRAADLRFTTEEAAELLRETVGTDLDADAVAKLAARTEGWAAGLQLAGLSLRGHADAAGFVETFSGSHRYILDFLTEEVLERQPDPTREFLLETSMLGRLSGPLCDAVTGRTGSQQSLEAIEKANLFLVPLDEQRGWWRYHHLFADLLRTRLQQDHGERAVDLHRRAAEWHDAHGLADDAVRHALAAGDPVWAARLIERYFDELLFSSEGATVRRWISALPGELVSARPRLLLVQAAAAIRRGRVSGVRELLDRAERAQQDTSDEPFEPSVGLAASRLANIPAVIALGRAYAAYLRGDAEATTTFVSRALTERGEGEWILDGLAHTNLAMAEWLHGRLDAAERAFASNIARWQVAGETDVAALHRSYLARIRCAGGRLDEAYATYRQTLETAAAPGLPALAGAGVAHVGVAEVAYQRDELATALHHVTEGITVCRRFADSQALATGLATLAWIRQAGHDVAGARDVMDEAYEIADPAVTDLFNPVPAERARLLLAHDDVDAAARWADERGLAATDAPNYPQEAAHLLLARVLTAQARPDLAVGLLDRLHAAAVAQDRYGSVIEIQALRAVALAAVGNEGAALTSLADALTLAHPQGYIRVFVDEGRLMAELLGQFIAADRDARSGVPVAYLGTLVRAFDRPDAGEPAGRSVPGLITQLTAREIEVLRLLSAGKANREIAGELYVTVNTVKHHVTHILDKLGATNRTEAVALARELGVLS
jgi:LuxR family transcriptional regulator, maltose regulon positive regulatory protein